MGLDGALSSDCAVLTPLIQPCGRCGVKPCATPPAAASTPSPMSSPSPGCGIELHEAKLPVNDTVRGVCELLGLDALNFANEGKLVIAVAREAENVLTHLRSHGTGRDAANRRGGRPRACVPSACTA
jgi:hydrogenase expression/formation protein HypE